MTQSAPQPVPSNVATPPLSRHPDPSGVWPVPPFVTRRTTVDQLTHTLTRTDVSVN